MFKNSNFSLAQWIKFAIVAVIYILFIIWVGNYWWLLLLIPIFDIYLTKIIPWTWWRKYKDTKPTLYTICSWLDAIVFALVAVYFINLYLFQNYQIPSSSLEKSLLVGDFLMVSKVSYGPRVPQTPLSMPLTQHTMPWSQTTKSYSELIKWDYKRLAGLDTIKSLDIVVFNFPAGDTVAVLQQNPDYYTLCAMYGRDFIKAHPEKFGEIICRPVDRRENYVKRCVGLPGDSLQIIDNHIYINGKPQHEPENMQLNYFIETDGRRMADSQFEELGVSVDDRNFVNAWAQGPNL
ncbi:MAG: signal peptidase I, partial [Paludibacteraceae bacterium]|nr:signal peptidase I [Paludibacteraceae bacterium]